MPGFVSLGWWLTPFWLRLDWLGKRLQSWGRVSQYSQTDLSYSCVIPWCPHVCYGVKLTQPRVFREGSRVIRLPQGHTYRGCSWLVIDAGGPAHCGRYLSMDRRVQEMEQVAKQEPASIQQTAFLHGFCFESLLEFCPDFLCDGRWPGGWVAFGHGIWYIDRMKVGWTGNYLVPSNILVSLVYSLVGKSNICAKSPALLHRPITSNRLLCVCVSEGHLWSDCNSVFSPLCGRKEAQHRKDLSSSFLVWGCASVCEEVHTYMCVYVETRVQPWGPGHSSVTRRPIKLFQVYCWHECPSEDSWSEKDPSVCVCVCVCLSVRLYYDQPACMPTYLLSICLSVFLSIFYHL